MFVSEISDVNFITSIIFDILFYNIKLFFHILNHQYENKKDLPLKIERWKTDR